MKVDLIRDGTQNTVIAVTITPEDTILFGEHPLHGLDLPTRGSNIIRRLLEIATAVEGGVASAKASREARMARRDLRQAMEAAGASTTDRLHLTSFDRVIAEADARELLAKRPWPRAIFAKTRSCRTR